MIFIILLFILKLKDWVFYGILFECYDNGLSMINYFLVFRIDRFNLESD